MAKQAGTIKLTGTMDDLCFYKMEGKYYVRRKSSLNGKRFQKDAVFTGSRKSASRFGEGNRLASMVYRTIAKEKRVYSLFCFLKRRSILLLKEGKSLRETEALLRDYLVDLGLMETERQKVVSAKGIFLSKEISGSKTRHLPGRVKTKVTQMEMAAFKPSYPLSFWPDLHSAFSLAGRSALRFPLQGVSLWRPKKTMPLAALTNLVWLRQVCYGQNRIDPFAEEKSP